jgi:LmbE family N-acetylglucosaminyl deacetylase
LTSPVGQGKLIHKAGFVTSEEKAFPDHRSGTREKMIRRCRRGKMDSRSAVLGRKTMATLPVPNPLTRRLARSLLGRVAHHAAPAELQAPALVFSPHPDDESLGCGGTILKKKQAGASVKLVHVSDGGGSTNLIPRGELTAMRRKECVDAGRVLGVDDIYFLDFPDGHLWEHMPAASDRVEEILRRESPEQIFLPYFREPMRQASDHVAVTRIVLEALRRQTKPVTVWEYPVWFWLQWPWVGFQQNTPPIKPKHILKNSLLGGFGMRALFELRQQVNVADVLEQKRAAIAQHKSQTEKLIDDPRWITLEELSNGELMDCFYQDREFFRCYSYKGE